MKAFLHRLHLWVGIPIGIMLLIFSVTGILMNIPSLSSETLVSRAWMPERYQARDWSNGALRGSCDGLLYGSCGVWTEQGGSAGLDGRNVLALARGADERYFAVTPSRLWVGSPGHWQPVALPESDRWCWIARDGERLLLTGRASVLSAAPPYSDWQRVSLEPPTESVALPALVKKLHSGHLFGAIGRGVVIVLGVFLALLSATGLLHVALKRRPNRKQYVELFRNNLKLHFHIGKILLVLLLLICLTGAFLRPPLRPLIADITMDATAELQQCCRDKVAGDYLVVTQGGFYSLPALGERPTRLQSAPPIGRKGLTVLQQQDDGSWLVGSDKGLYRWLRSTGEQSLLAEGNIAGYTARTGAVDAKRGTKLLPQPAAVATAPISLRSIAMDIHNGRLFFGNGGAVWVFLGGLLSLLVFLSGWMILPKKPRRKSQS